ncbi:nuclear transport factor 2 family protein [Thalassoporum mexicanum]|uniref:nuclear transport factor 2 family protein n=1 Tax=Thalassoporum mexicanum TaxID=3457544 RepID=UPI0002E5E867|nr:nuclear transport factor 2 family protein [Pseudanabaena sp. PCC 7367]
MTNPNQLTLAQKPPTLSPNNIQTRQISIAGIDEPNVIAYFQTLANQDFEATASLFAPDGELCPPFEDGVVGKVAIANYLAQEAIGIKPNPKEGFAEYFADGTVHLKITGRVELPWCAVNVAWRFALDRNRQITCVAIDLLATMQELLKFRNNRG